MKKIFITLIILLVFTVPLFAVFAKTGTASLQFLKLGVDARAIGMGEAFTAVSDDVSSVYWNPAGLAMHHDRQIFFSHTNWVADTYHEFVAASIPTNYGFFAVFASVFHTTRMEETCELMFGPTGRYFYFSNIATGLTYANAFTDRFSFGLTGKYLRENIADESVNSVAFDVGSRYNTGFRNVIIGMSLRNFGPDVRYRIDDHRPELKLDDRFDTFDDDEDGIGTPFPMPMNFSLGIVGDLYRETDRYLIASAQLDNCIDRKETWNLGTEYNINNLFLRGGYQIGLDAASWSAGFGVKVPTRTAIFNIDYAFTHMGRLQEDFMSGAHRISLKMSF
jgi:long-subunit fatty acid transport protein